jgi:hypothetical protein
MTKCCPGKALVFLFGGAVLLYGLWLLIALGNMGGAAGDGISGGRTSPAGTVIPFGCYFLCGIIASLIPNRTVRKCLAVIGHISPFAVVVSQRSWDSLGFVLIASSVLLVFFGFSWREMLQKSKSNC